MIENCLIIMSFGMNPINGGSPPSERIEINIDVFVNFPKNAF